MFFGLNNILALEQHYLQSNSPILTQLVSMVTWKCLYFHLLLWNVVQNVEMSDLDASIQFFLARSLVAGSRNSKKLTEQNAVFDRILDGCMWGDHPIFPAYSCTNATELRTESFKV